MVVAFIQLVENYRAILEQAQSITGVTYLPSVNGNSSATPGGRPTSASSVNRGVGQGVLTQEMMDGMLQNATYGMQMLDVALRAKSLQGPGPPTSQHYPQQHPSQHPSQPSINSTSSLTASSNHQVQSTSSTTSVNTGPSSSYGYNTNSHPHSQQQQHHSNSNSSSPRIMKDSGGGGGGGGGGGVKGVADDGGRKVKSEGSVDKGVPANGTSASSTTTTINATTTVSTGVTGASAGSTAPTSGDRSKRQVGF